MRGILLTIFLASLVILIAWAGFPVTADDGSAGPTLAAAARVEGRPATSSLHLLDRGGAAKVRPATKGGTAPPMGPIPIAYPGGGPTAVAAGAPAAGAFPGTGLGGFFGNLFAPAPPAPTGFPASFLTAGGTAGFLVTGAYAWHSPFTAAGGPGGSMARVLAAAAAVPPTTPFAPAPTAGFSIFTTMMAPGPPGPTGIVGGPGIFAGVRIGGTAAPASAAFCGLVIGGPGFTAMWAGNGLGAPAGTPALPPLRVGFFPPFFATGSPILATAAPPAAYIAGCFADSSTTPVELQSFHIE